jgi:cyclophilin family peptidyl-prolyl cis-trans isomerase
MARTADPDSATAQFYINVKDNQFLDFPNAGGSGYAVFGKIVQGMDVVDKIKSTKTGQKTVMSMGPSGLVSVPFQDVPANNIVIESVKVK